MSPEQEEEDDKNIPTHVKTMSQSSWKNLDPMRVFRHMGPSDYSFTLEAMENYVFPDEIKTKLMKMRKLMNISHYP